MKPRHLLALSSVVFMVSVLVSASIVQAKTAILCETKKSAFVTYVTHYLYTNSPSGAPSAAGMADILRILKTLDAPDAVNLTKQLDFILSGENVSIGNETVWGWPSLGEDLKTYVNELYIPSVIVATFKLLGFSDRLNRTALVDLVMSRYNVSDGAFHEPVLTVKTEQGDEEYAKCFFPLAFPGGMYDAYANPNMISTFLAVSILADFGALDAINVTKTIEWVLSCKAENGVFGPFPAAQPEYLPGWSSLRTNRFTVDEYGAGVPFTYAALGTLRILGVNVTNAVDIAKVKNYVLACESVPGSNLLIFNDFPGGTGGWPHSTFFAFMTLQYIGVLQETNLPSRFVAFLQYSQNSGSSFSLDNSWPIPGIKDATLYGSSGWNDVWTTIILNMTGNLSVLDQPTPRVYATWINLVEFSTLTTVATFGASAGVLRIRSWKRAADQKEDLHSHFQTNNVV